MPSTNAGQGPEDALGGPELARRAEADDGSVPWRNWGPYLAERAWGTVREDYSANGDAWAAFTHDQARSRAYRWNEDGLAGVCDANQNFCFALALWNGRDPILKERAFGLTNGEGNHGEDVKDHYWYLDNTPSHSWMRWRYHYPQTEFPYAELIEKNAQRGREVGEFEITDTAAFAENRFWQVTVDYAKAGPFDYCLRVTVANRGPDEATLHVLPHLWFRNTWDWARHDDLARPVLRASEGSLQGSHPRIADVRLDGDGAPAALVCENETNTARITGEPNGCRYPKDGINDHVVHGAPTVAPDGVGTKGALWYRLTVPAGGEAVVRLRLRGGESAASQAGDLGEGWSTTLADREREADQFWAEVTGPDLDPARVAVVRQALSGVLWSKQFYHYDVDRWLTGDPHQPPPAQQRLTGRNHAWRHLDNHDVVIMPDKWEYPWYAAWDLAFHCVAVAAVDPKLAKEQLILLGREWYMHPSGQLPAYEWDFGDVNPPVHAWAALRVFEIDGGTDYDFLERIFHKLLLNFTWWVNREDAEGKNVFAGGFLGLDNIGPFDRSTLPVAGRLEQSDGTAWMARYCLDLLDMALTLSMHDATYSDVATKFFEHFAYISAAIVDQGIWDEQDGFFYDVLQLPDGERVPLRYRSMVGLLPLCAVLALSDDHLAALPDFTGRMQWFIDKRPQYAHGLAFARETGTGHRLLSVVAPDQLRRLVGRLLDEAEFLSPHGLRAMSAAHRDDPFTIDVAGITATVDYEPAESRSGLFGGNSNWRGPVWFPLNVLLVSALRRFHHHVGDTFTVPFRGEEITLGAAADEISERLVALFLPDAAGQVPAAGGTEWPPGHLWFHEYFDGDTGAGIGASHQTGWTAMVASLVLGTS